MYEGELLLYRYIIEKMISESYGGTSEKYLAWDMISKKYVAVNFRKKANLTIKDFRLKRLMRKMTPGGILDHPNIIRVLDEGMLENKPFYIMEYVDGQNLRRWAIKNRYSISFLPSVLEKFEIISLTLGCIHKYGMIHENLKPENVIITPDGNVKLMDFGLMKKVDVGMMIEFDPRTFIENAIYTSPEQASGKEVDPRCDIYVLGIMLYEMLIGKLPFKYNGLIYEGPIAILFQHVHTEPPSCREINPNIPENLDKLIMKILSKNPDDRPQTMHEVEESLKAIRLGLPPFLGQS